MTFRKEEGTVMGRFLGCLAREGIEALHRTEEKRKFQLKAELGASTQTGRGEGLVSVALLQE